MKRNVTVILISFLLLLFSVSLLSAQDREQFQRERRERDLRETIKVYMYYKMKAALNLTEEQQEAVIPKVEEMELARQRFMDERKKLLQELESMLSDQRASDEGIIKQLSLFKKIEESQRKDEETILAQINEILNARQRARFVIFMFDFRKELQDKIDNIRRMQENEQMRRRRAQEQNPQREDDGY